MDNILGWILRSGMLFVLLLVGVNVGMILIFFENEKSDGWW